MTGLRFATVQLETGPRLRYAETGDADGTPVVFLHGWPDSGFSFSRVLPLLPRSVRALIPDQRGFGDSERVAGGYRIADFASDVAAFLDAVSVTRATVVGHSFGSFVARQAAMAYPGRIESVVLIGTGIPAVNPVLREVQATIRELPDPIPMEFAREFQASTAYCPLPAGFFDRIVAESMKLPAPLWREVLDGILAYDDLAQLPGMAARTLLLWGERDALFPRTDQDRLQAMIQDSKLTIYPDTGHCPNWERPERFATDLQAFLLMRI